MDLVLFALITVDVSISEPNCHYSVSRAVDRDAGFSGVVEMSQNAYRAENVITKGVQNIVFRNVVFNVFFMLKGYYGGMILQCGMVI